MGFYFNINQIIDNIKKQTSNYNRIFYINDQHKKDDKEFQYLYPHATDPFRTSLLNDIFKNKELYYFHKSTLSPFHNEHILKLCQVLKIDKYTLCGGTASDDILATCYHLIDLKKDVVVLKDCIGDIKEERLSRAIQILNEISV